MQLLTLVSAVAFMKTKVERVIRTKMLHIIRTKGLSLAAAVDLALCRLVFPSAWCFRLISLTGFANEPMRISVPLLPSCGWLLKPTLLLPALNDRQLLPTGFLEGLYLALPAIVGVQPEAFGAPYARAFEDDLL